MAPALLLLAWLAAELPEGNAYVRGLVDKQRKREEQIDDYSFDVHEAREELDAGGRVAGRRSRRYEAFFVKGRRVRRLVAEDGRPLEGARQREEDARVRAQVEAIARGEVVTEQAHIRLSRILERFDFRTLGREELDGRPALVLAFAPRPGARAQDSEEVLRSLEGRIWVDEAEHEVVRAELKNHRGFGRGLGTSVQSLSAVMEFRKVDDTVWLPIRIETEVAGKALFVQAFHMRTRVYYENFRRFEVESEEHVR